MTEPAIGLLKVTEAEAETGELSWKATLALTVTTSPVLNLALARGVRTATLRAPEIETETEADATCPLLRAWTLIAHVPRGSVKSIEYRAEYVPEVEVSERLIVAPVGPLTVTEAPETGVPPELTAALIVTVSPRLKTIPLLGPRIVTESA